MFKQSIITAYLMISLAGLYAQEDHTYAFVLNPEGDAGLKPATAYKFEVVGKVYKDLLQARGDARQQAPELTMNDGARFVAWMDPKKVRIGMEEKAYDVCVRFGADSLAAMAALLAHELTHYFEKHDWSRNFAHGHSELSAAKAIGQMDEGLKQETQADYMGGVLAFSAGYNVYGIMPRLLPQIYQSYGLPETLPGYPSLTERVAVSQNAMSQLLDLQTVFETARYLSILENYESAAQYHRHILQQFQSREIYNNAGVNLALAALPYFGPAEMPYILPLETDAYSRLHSLKNVQSDRLEIRKALLDEALQQFDRAILLDPKYAPAYLHKACVYAVNSEWDEAEFWLKKGRRHADAAKAAGFEALEGILLAMQGDTAKAEAALGAAQKRGNVLAGLNLDILQGVPRVPPRDVTTPSMERIDNFVIDDFLRSPAVEKEIKVSRQVICGKKKLAQSALWLHYENDGQQYAVIHWCDGTGKNQTGKGIGKGAVSAAVMEAYGTPQRVLPDQGGTLWAYPGLGLLFSISPQGQVAGWGTYRKSK
jgi:tetratricopeptide (TPR) repeat protein